ncbi:redoxin domain-containing protein [Actinocrispum sp. NPDC049592]|uniref:redoxin domain-containing protein n=1 Tax=Actinocrispum sp. NPDC049592 TaxID=3154835 RepID=UPI00341A2034
MVRGLVALLLVVLAGCGAPQASAPRQAPAAPGQVPKLLQFSAKTLDDKDFSGQSLLGKPAVLWFWAPWCPRCQGEAPHLGSLAHDNAGKITFVGVGAQDGVPAMKKFVAENKVDGFAHLADVDAAIWKKFGVTEQPAYAFIQADGTTQVVKQQLTEEGLNEKVRELSADPKNGP